MGLTVDKCLQAWTNSLRQMNARVDVVFFGDSLTYYGDFASVFPNKAVCNLGLRGDTIQGMINRIEQLRVLAPSSVFLMAGINDVANITMTEFKSLYEELLFRICSVIPKADVIVHSLLPVNNEDFTISCNNKQIGKCNEIISKLAECFNTKYLDLFSLYAENGLLPSIITADGIHLKKAGYNKWYDLISKMY